MTNKLPIKELPEIQFYCIKGNRKWNVLVQILPDNEILDIGLFFPELFEGLQQKVNYITDPELVDNYFEHKLERYRVWEIVKLTARIKNRIQEYKLNGK